MARRIILQDPDSGLDVFLKELSKYASPQYQLALKNQNRADARLELSKRQMGVNEDRYQDSLEQQRFQNKIATQNAEINKEKFEIDKSNSNFEIAKQYINESFSGMNAQEIAGMNIDSLLIDVADPRAKSRARQYANNIQGSGKRQLQTIISRMNLYNQGKDTDSQISKAEALDLFGDDKTYNEFLVNNYLKQGSLNDEQKYLINSNTTRLTALRKNQSDLLTQQASGIDVTDALAQNNIVIQNLQGEIDRILKPSGDDSTGTTINPYENTGSSGDETIIPTKKTLTPPVRIFDPIDSSSLADVEFEDQELYNILFADEEDIAESAVDMANRNASEENVKDVVIDSIKKPADELDESVTEKDIKDMLTEAKEEGKDEEVDFLESALSGLSSLGAREREEPNIEPVEAELFSNVRPTELSGIRKQDGSFVNVESLSSSIGGSLKKIKALKDRYKKAEGNSKLIIARALSNEQSKLQEIKPFISKEGTFSNKKFNDKFYKRLSKRANMTIDELKSLILFNMDYNI